MIAIHTNFHCENGTLCIAICILYNFIKFIMNDSQHATRLLGSSEYRFTHKGNFLSQSCMISIICS